MSSTAVIIEEGDIALGLALRNTHGFRFYASHPSTHRLEGRQFASLRQVHMQARAALSRS